MSEGYFVYVIGPREGPFKIGITSNVGRRRSIVNVGNHQYLFVHYEYEAKDKTEATTIETEVHYQFAEKHIRGEWFALELKDLSDVRHAISKSLLFATAPEGWSLMRKTAEEFTPEVCQIARNALGLTTAQLAKAANIPESTLIAFERKEKTPIEATIDTLKVTLESKGVEFIPQGPDKRYKVLI